MASALKAAIRPHGEAPNRLWHIVAEAHHKLSDVLDPRYLSARIAEIAPGDEFSIRHASHGFVVKGYVTAVDKDAGALAFYIMGAVDLTTVPTIMYDFADATLSQQVGGWAVLRPDGGLIRGGFSTEAAANEWLAHRRALAAAGKVA